MHDVSCPCQLHRSVHFWCLHIYMQGELQAMWQRVHPDRRLLLFGGLHGGNGVYQQSVRLLGNDEIMQRHLHHQHRLLLLERMHRGQDLHE